jgi:hypothetical protein
MNFGRFSPNFTKFGRFFQKPAGSEGTDFLVSAGFLNTGWKLGRASGGGRREELEMEGCCADCCSVLLGDKESNCVWENLEGTGALIMLHMNHPFVLQWTV